MSAPCISGPWSVVGTLMQPTGKPESVSRGPVLIGCPIT